MNKIKFCPVCRSELAEIQEDGKVLNGCPSDNCDYIFWDSPVPVLAAIVEHENMVILARNRAWPEKMFGLITGFLEKGEKPEEGIQREVYEELGLKSEIEGLVGVYSFEKMNQLIVAYHVKGEGRINLGEELAEIKHIPVEKLKPWPFGTGFAVSDWLKKQGM